MSDGKKAVEADEGEEDRASPSPMEEEKDGDRPEDEEEVG